ncbi:DUF4302 domain-containing protein [Prevotella sp.]|uniref:DUF4302 domain-containing protein n=1 Tax=Prevotella sp. TaxID=59823 RepID=UPI00307C4F80
MKKLYNAFIMLFSILSFTACVTEVDDVFDKNASQRVEEAINDTRKILEAPANGWRIEYYGDTSYGGYNLLVKFEGDSVLVAGEKVADSHKAGFGADGKLLKEKTHYKIEQSMGVVISMDEYNSIFHYFSAPKNEDGIGSAGEGMDGDFEFRLVSATAEKVELKGKKHDTKIVMYPMDENTSWDQYIKEVGETQEFMSSRSYTLSLKKGEEEVEIPAGSSYRRLYFRDKDEEGNATVVYAPYIVTPKGYTFYNPVTVGGVEISGFDKADTQEYFEATGNNTVKLITEVPQLFTTLTTSQWFISYEDMGEYGKAQWNVLLEKLGKADNNKRARLYYAAIGYHSSKYQGFFMQAGNESYNGGMVFSPVKDENGNTLGDRVTITRDPRAENNSKNCDEKKKYQKNVNGIKSAMDPFCGGFGHTFQLETDNLRKPTYIKMTDVNDPTNWIIVHADAKQFPFGDLDNDNKN